MIDFAWVLVVIVVLFCAVIWYGVNSLTAVESGKMKDCFDKPNKKPVKKVPVPKKKARRV